MQLARSRALNMSLNNIGTATHTVLRTREEKRRNAVIRFKKRRLEGVNE